MSQFSNYPCHVDMKKCNHNFVLASASKTRKKLLVDALDWNIIALQPNFDESVIPLLSSPASYVQILAHAKAYTALKNVNSHSLILGCDTVMVLDNDNEIIGNPKSSDEAIALLYKISGKTVRFVTGHTLVDSETKSIFESCEYTKLRFQLLSKETIENYVRSGLWAGKIGGIDIQGYAASFIDKIEGCYTNPIGISLPTLMCGIEKLGFNSTMFKSLTN